MKKIIALSTALALLFLAFGKSHPPPSNGRESDSNPLASFARNVKSLSLSKPDAEHLSEVPPGPPTSPGGNPDPAANSLQADIQNDLKYIDDHQLVQIINDPQTPRNEKEEALKFMENYLSKVTRYLKLRNEQLQRKLEASNG